MRIAMADITRILGVDTAFTARVLVAGPQETPPQSWTRYENVTVNANSTLDASLGGPRLERLYREVIGLL